MYIIKRNDGYYLADNNISNTNSLFFTPDKYNQKIRFFNTKDEAVSFLCNDPEINKWIVPKKYKKICKIVEVRIFRKFQEI